MEAPWLRPSRARTERIAARLRYALLDAARGLVRRRTHAIAAMLPDLFGEFTHLGHAALERLVTRMQTADGPEANVTTPACEVVARTSCCVCAAPSAAA